MNEIIKINYEAEQPTVSARDLHEGLEIKSNFTTWFDRMCEYGFTENDYKKCFPNLESGCNGGQNMVDYQISVDMAKQICMIQRSEKGRQYRQYFLDLEKAWNTPEQVMARALKVAGQTIDKLKGENAGLLEDVQRMRPKAIFADAVATSHSSILIGDLAKLIKQNGVDIGQKRLFAWMRGNGYLIKRNGSDWNMPTQKSMEMGLFEVKESTVNNPDGSVRINKTTKVTGKGQQYFINKFLNGAEDKEAS
jgi:anti-repressor protein